MAKRAAPDEQPYRPLLDAGLVSAAMAQTSPSTPVSAIKETSSVSGLSRLSVESHRVEPSKQNQAREKIRFDAQPSPRLLSERESAHSFVEKFDQEKRILFTRSETQAIDRLVTSLARRLNAQVKVSHVVRSLIALLLNAESEIDTRAGEAPPLVRPANGDAQALQRFEKDIARILASGFRDAPPLREP